MNANEKKVEKKQENLCEGVVHLSIMQLWVIEPLQLNLKLKTTIEIKIKNNGSNEEVEVDN